MESHPILLICNSISTFILVLGFLLALYDRGFGAQIKRWSVRGLVLIGLAALLFAASWWWEAKREEELIAWQSADQCGTARCLQAYLEQYPKGRYAESARARLESLTESRNPEPFTPPPTDSDAPLPPAAALLSGRYHDNDDGTVTDTQTGLQWMRCAMGQVWKGTCAGEVAEYPWPAVLDAVESFNRQSGYAGYRDWRVPSREELRSLIYCSSGRPKVWNTTGQQCQGDFNRPTIDSAAFPKTPASAFWSGAADAGNADDIWDVSFSVGGDVRDDQSDTGPVRLVRAGR